MRDNTTKSLQVLGSGALRSIARRVQLHCMVPKWFWNHNTSAEQAPCSRARSEQASLRVILYYPGKNETLSVNCDEALSMNIRHVILLVSTLDCIHLQDCITMLTDCDK